MVETDGPVRFGGVEATPRLIPGVVERIAEVKGLRETEVAAEIFNTCRRFLPRVAEAEGKLKGLGGLGSHIYRGSRLRSR